MTTRHVELRIAANHPSLPGHFPGRPIVPGVVLLDQAIAAAEDWLQRPLRIASLQQAKFTRPLLPGEAATLALTFRDQELRFEVQRADERIAQGVFRLAAQ